MWPSTTNETTYGGEHGKVDHKVQNVTNLQWIQSGVFVDCGNGRERGEAVQLPGSE